MANQISDHLNADIIEGVYNSPPIPLSKRRVGAFKIKDALFIGDKLASEDKEFINKNKVTHIINCSGLEIENHWESKGVVYLTFFWNDSDDQVLFDHGNKITTEIFNFIENANENGESVLIHSYRGNNRAFVVLIVFL